jgi:membrane-associated protease RseP (regulator of RpoE activity)
MKPESAAAGADVSSCPSCRAALVPGMRFCRMCGYRLGEGVEEYAETRRFDGKMPTMDAPRASGPTAAPGTPFQPASAWGAMTPIQPLSAEQVRDSTFGRMARALNPLRLGWMFWVILSIVVITSGAIAIRQAVRGGAFGGRSARTAPAPRSFLEVDGFESVDGGGAMIEGLAAPDTSLERAGLFGGDIITKFDGKVIKDAGDMRRVEAATPPGKTVEVEFIRDSELKKTTLTTAGRDGYRGLDALRERPGGYGKIGIDDYDRVRVPGTPNSFGVQIDVDSNGPADIAGLKDGDIVTDFGGKLVRTAGDLRLRIYEAVPGSTVPVVVVRDGARVEIPVKIGRTRD